MIQVFGLPARLILVYITLFLLFPFFIKKGYLTFIISYLLLLVGISVLIQRPMMLYFIQPNYLPQWVNLDFFAITEIMNTILDVNLAAVIPLGYTFFKFWKETERKATELEKKNSSLSKGDGGFLYLKVEKTLQKIFYNDILFIESLKNYVKVKTREREIIAYKSIVSMESSLPREKFLRVHRSFIVGVDFIDSFSPSKLEINGHTIPVGRKYKEQVKEILGYF